MTDQTKDVGEQLQKALHDLRDIKARADANGKEREEDRAALAKANAAIDEMREQVKAAEAKAAEIAERADGLETKLNRRQMATSGLEPEVKAADLLAFRRQSGNAEAGEKDYLEAKAALDGYLRRGREPDALKALSVDDDSHGGYTVLPDTSGRIARFIFETSPLRQFASVQVIGTDALEGLYDIDEPESAWVGERSARSETDTPDLGQYRIPTHEQFAKPAATQKILDDSNINIEAWLAGKVQRKFARQEATAFVTGDGVTKPRGFLTYPAGVPGNTVSTWRQIQQRDTGVAGGFPATNPGDVLIELMHDLKAEYRPGAIYAMSRRTMAGVRTLKDADGKYLFTMNFADNQMSERLLGSPISEFNDMPDFDASGALAIAYANFSVAYQIVDRMGVRTLRDPFSRKPFVEFYTTRRVGGDVVNFEAIALLNFSA